LGNDVDNAEDSRYFSVSIQPVSNIAVEHAQADVVIDDDDHAGVTVEPIDTQTDYKGDQGSFRVKLNAKPAAAVTITFDVDDKTEAKLLTSKLTFTAANKWQTVKVKGLPDGIDDGNVPFQVFATGVTSRDPSYNGLYVPEVAMSNACNDAKPGVTVEVDDSQTSWDGDTGSFRVRLNTAPADDVTIQLSSSNTSEGTVDTTQLFFTPFDWADWKTATVTGQPNGKLEGTVSYKIVTSATASADPKYNRLTVADVAMVNACGPRPAHVSIKPVYTETTWQGGTGEFWVRLESKPTASVTIVLTPEPASEGKILSANPVFTASNWSTWKKITVKGLPDGVKDIEHEYWIRTSGAISTDPNYSGMDVADVQMVNLCDDYVAPKPGAYTVWIDNHSCCRIYDVSGQIDTNQGKNIGNYSSGNDHTAYLFADDGGYPAWVWWQFTYNGHTDPAEFGSLTTVDQDVNAHGVVVHVYDSEPLRAAGGPAAGAGRLDTLSAAALWPLWQEALALWRDSGVDNASLDRLAWTRVEIADLPGNLLGLATPGAIYVDRNAAGYGWFVDPTPQTSAEFTQTSPTSFRATATSPAAGRMDLLTVLSHEVGHVLGFKDLDATIAPDNLMAGMLGAGQRRVLPTAAVDAAFAIL
jgi:hypothetical protein